MQCMALTGAQRDQKVRRAQRGGEGERDCPTPGLLLYNYWPTPLLSDSGTDQASGTTKQEQTVKPQLQPTSHGLPLCACYAKSGIHIAYPLTGQTFNTAPKPASSAIVLRACYAMSCTDRAYNDGARPNRTSRKR
eukprot:161545-Rhodomonas_salina.1